MHLVQGFVVEAVDEEEADPSTITKVTTKGPTNILKARRERARPTVPDMDQDVTEEEVVATDTEDHHHHHHLEGLVALT